MKNSILKALNKLTGGKGDKKSLSDFPSKEVAMGQKVEMEHTSDPKLADEITADHLTEDPHYYSKLKESGLADELEKGARGDWKKEGYKLSHRIKKSPMTGNPVIFVDAHSPTGEIVGKYRFDNSASDLYPILSETHPEHQRKGLASAAYSYIQAKTKKKISPSSSQTSEAKALWSQPNRPFGKTESLIKAPVEYTPDPQDTHKKIPALNDTYPVINKVNLPNGLIYQQHTKNDYMGPVHVHHLYHPNEKNPVAEVITRPDPENEMNHQVSYSQVSPEHKGKGLGKQAYLAALVHGKGVGRLVSDNDVSQNAHKLWGQFKNVKGLGGKIGKYVTQRMYDKGVSDSDYARAHQDQHQVFIKQKSALDHNAMFPPVEMGGQEKLAASESLEKDQPTLKFPKVKDVPTRTDVEMYSIPEGRTKSANRKKEIAARAGTNRARLGYEEMSGKKLPQASYDKDVANKKKLISEIANSRDKKGVMAGVVATPGSGGKAFKNRSIGYYSESQPRYIQQHEAAHLTLQHIADKHGENARRKVVDHLLAHFHPDDVNAMARKLGGGSYSQSNHLSEEVLNFLHDLPHKDEKTKAHYAAHGVDENRVKAGWKRASQYAREKITPEWLADEGSEVNSIREQSKGLRPTDLTLKNPGKLAASEDIKKSLNRKTGVSGVSENIGLDRLKQIKQDNYVGAGGKDYSPDELHQRMFEIQDKQAAKQKLFPEQESEKTHGSFEEMAPPMMPKVKKFEISDAIVKGSARNELKKAIDPKDFKKIQTSHQKGFSPVVDSASHIKDHPAHENFVNHIVNGPSVYKSKGKRGIEAGIATKNIHHLDSYHDEEGGGNISLANPESYMTKPYHGHLESATKSYVKHPIKGWATLTKKNLLHAAGMGHMTEDVQAHNMNGVPVTVHKFSDQHEPVVSTYQQISPVDAGKIAVMDFLTGNNDRHIGNIMVSKEKNEQGFHDPLLIDHERSFQYEKSLHNKFDKERNTPDSVYGHLNGSSGLAFVSSSHKPVHFQEAGEELHDWWGQHAPQIKQAFQENIRHIKDPHLKSHIENNFNARMDHLDEHLTHGNYYYILQGRRNPFTLKHEATIGGVHVLPFKKPRGVK